MTVKTYDYDKFAYVDLPKTYQEFRFFLDDHNRIDVTIENGKLRLLGSGDNMPRLKIFAHSSNVIYVDLE